MPHGRRVPFHPAMKSRPFLTTLLLALSILAALPARAETLSLFAGGGTKTEGAATGVQLKEPFGLEFAPDGSAVIVEMEGGQRVWRVGTDGQARVIAGTGAKGFAGDGGPALQAQFNGIHNLAILPTGDILLADTWNQRVRKIDAKTGVITTVLGTGKKGFGGDGGPAEKADFGMIIQIALDAKAENLYLADIENHRIRRWNLAKNRVETVAGDGKKGVPKSGGKATSEPLVDPRAVVPDSLGGFYILERSGNALRYVDKAGRITTVAGTGKAGNTGDDGPALSATLNGPKHLCMDLDGTVIIADAENHVIRRYSPKDGRITRLAGTGQKGAGPAGKDPLSTALARPHGVTVAKDGTLYITDTYNARVLTLPPKK